MIELQKKCDKEKRVLVTKDNLKIKISGKEAGT